MQAYRPLLGFRTCLTPNALLEILKVNPLFWFRDEDDFDDDWDDEDDLGDDEDFDEDW